MLILQRQYEEESIFLVLALGFEKPPVRQC
jgi:hypothetical protein